MSDLREFITAWLTATFGHVDGSITLADLAPDLQGTTEIDDVDSLTSFCKDAKGHVYASLTTATGEGAGFCLEFADYNRSSAAIDILDPSFIVSADGGPYCLVYLTEAAPEDLLDLFEPSDGFSAETSVPLPYNDFILSEEDERRLESNEGFTIYSLTDIEQAFFPSDAVTALNDAEIHGEISEDILGKEIVLSLGADSTTKNWKVSPKAEFRHFLSNQLSIHVPGQKDGKCFVTGEVSGGRRNKNAIKALYLLGLDSDTGASLDKTFKRVQDLGLFAVFYTTHSHNATEIRIKQNDYHKWSEKEEVDPEPTTENCRAYLRTKHKYTSEIVDSVEYVETVHDETGVAHILHCAPIEKFRIVFVLEHPYVIAEMKMAQSDAIRMWEGKILGLGKMLGIQVDRAARDPSRLFYLPRHPKKSKDYRILVNAGSALDIDDVPVADIRDTSVDLDEDNPFAAAGAVLAGRVAGREMAPSGLDLRRWAHEHGDGFMIAKVFEDYAEDRIRDRQTEHKFTVECPFDEDHSNAGDPEDPGCYVQDAGLDSDNFVFHCSHDSCAGRDRLVLLEKALKDNWFPDAVLTEDAYDSVERVDDSGGEDGDETKEEKPKKDSLSKNYAKALKEISDLESPVHPEKTEYILRLLIGQNKLATDTMLKDMAKKGCGDLSTLRSILKRMESEDTSEVEDKPFDLADAAERVLKRFSSLKQATSDVRKAEDRYRKIVIVNEDHPIEVIDYFIASIEWVNSRKPQLFRWGEEKVRIVETADGNYDTSVLNKLVIQNLAKNELILVKPEVTNRAATMPAPEWLTEMVAIDPKLKLMPLIGFATMPFLNKDGKLITQDGYDPASERLLRLPKGFQLTSAYKPHPTDEDIDFIKDEFDRIFGDFPFDDANDTEGGPASKAHLYCLMLQPIVRDLIQGPTPMYVVDKPTAGTGASLLVSSAMTISTGQAPGTQSLPNNEDELKKNITSQFDSGQSVIFFDNVNVKLNSGHLANLCTAEVWTDRVLGKSEISSIPNRMLTICAGNNIDASAENKRRFLFINMNFKDDPTRPGRTFQVPRLKEFVQENQADLFGMLLTLVARWIDAGMPKWTGEPLSSFERYCEIMGGILETCGIPGFMENRHLNASAADADKAAWVNFIHSIVDKWGFNAPQSLGTLVRHYVDMPEQPQLVVNGGIRVPASDDESRVMPHMRTCLEKMNNHVFYIFWKKKGEDVEIKVTLKREINPKTGVISYAVTEIEDTEE